MRKRIGEKTIYKVIEHAAKVKQKKLILSGYQLNDLPSEIGQLTNLSELYVSGNSLTRLPPEIGQLTSLSVLYLSGNKILNFPSEIGQLTNLSELYLSGNNLTKFPLFISQLTKLSVLDLSDNEIERLPPEIGQLTSLKELHLSFNLLSSLPRELGRLKNLITLNLYKNLLTSIPPEVNQLTNLKELFLNNNQLTSLLPEIGQLISLKELHLSFNLLSNLPNEVNRLVNLTTITLEQNPLEMPPPEVVSKGASAIREYLKEIEVKGKDYLYEAKLLMVGEPGAGKTTLSKKIKNPDYILQDEETSTEGIDVYQWVFQMENGRPFKVNIWDFGGQEIYHATHQFFLTERSLYVLVADTRKEDTDFHYWLNIVELLSGNSPLLVIKNEKQDRYREINERQLMGQFENYKATLVTNLATNRGLSEIIINIKHYIKSLPHIGSALPKTWLKIREILENDPRNYIRLEEYFDICQKNEFTKNKDKLMLSGYLHDLGVCLHFQKDPVLKKTLILKPKWGTDAVYKVLDNKEVIRNFGSFNKSDLLDIWCEKEYENMQDELLQLMVNFQLCYKIPKSLDKFIAPQLLSENQPVYDWEESDNLRLRYTYKFMPKGIITRFIVAMHDLIAEHKYVWKNGLIIEKDQTKAEVIEYYHDKEIQIRIVGKNKKDLMAIIIWELDKIHESFHQLKSIKLIPCNCTICKDDIDPHFYPLETLMKFRSDKQDQIQCLKSYEMVYVGRLIGDVLDKEDLYIQHSLAKDIYRKTEIHIQNIAEAKFMSNDKREVHIGGDVTATGSTMNILSDISGKVSYSVQQIPPSDNPSEPGLKELLIKLQSSIENANENEIRLEDKIDALEEVKTLAETSQQSGPIEKQKSIVRKSLKYLKGLASELPTATKIAEELKKLITAISAFF